MKIVLTGSSGRVGRAIFAALAREGHDIVGVDLIPFSTTRIVGDCASEEFMRRIMEGAEALIHTAGPHAPHVDVQDDRVFARVNVEATGMLFRAASDLGLSRFVYTSTTALYGGAVRAGECTWIDENTPPEPRTVYHRTKFEAEQCLEDLACPRLPVRVLRISRCFPEPAPAMAIFRNHRGIDLRDVASGHVRALGYDGAVFERFILSGATPFLPGDAEALRHDAPAVLHERVPALTAEFTRRGWDLPQSVDRVCCPSRAQKNLGWRSLYGWQEVLAQAARQSLEVLPAGMAAAGQPEGSAMD